MTRFNIDGIDVIIDFIAILSYTDLDINLKGLIVFTTLRILNFPRTAAP
jgi:hypothetical protein